MQKKNKEKVSYRLTLVIVLLLAFILPSLTAQATNNGSITIQRFRVEDYRNLQDSTGQRSDHDNVPVEAQVIAGISYQLNKLLVSDTDTQVTTSTPVDSSFQARIEVTDNTGKAVFGTLSQGYLPEGYYLVSELLQNGQVAHTGRFVVRVPHLVTDMQGNVTTNYAVMLYPKGQEVVVKKNVMSTKQVVGVSDVISWEVWYPIGPDLKRETRNFYLTDEMDPRLEYVGDTVSLHYYDINRDEIALTLLEEVDYHLFYDVTENVLTIRFTDNIGTDKIANANVAYIGMTLDTSVSTLAIDTEEVLWNNARISFENTAGEIYEHVVFLQDLDKNDSRVPKVHLGQIVITKVDAEDTTKRLEGATFSIADSIENARAGNFLSHTSNTTPVGHRGLVGYVTSFLRQVFSTNVEEEIIVTTDTNGEIVIRPIGAGIYYLVETTPPRGYHRLAEPIEVTVADDRSQNITKVQIKGMRDATQEIDAGDTVGTGETTGTAGATGGEVEDGLREKGIVGSIKTGDVMRVTGILLLTTASLGIIVVILKREKQKKENVKKA